MPSSASAMPPFRFATLAALSAAAVLVFLELLRTMRGSLWIGFQLSDVLTILAAWAIYAGTIGAAVAVLTLLSKKNPLSDKKSLGLPYICAVAIWLSLAAFTRQLGWVGVTVGIIVLAVAALYLYVLTRNTTGLILVGAAGLVLSCLLGVVVAATIHDRFLLEPDMRTIATPAAFVVAVCTAALAAFSARRRIRVTVLLALVAAGAFTALRTSDEARAGLKDPNVLFITSDTLRADLCSVYGGPVPTPHLEGLAAQGASFDRSYSLAPWTLPSMMGLLASTYPPSPSPERTIEERRDEVGGYKFPDATPTLAELLQDRGYTTGAFVANTLLDDPDGFLRGFDRHIVVGHRTHVVTGFFQVVPMLQHVLRQPFPGLVRPRPVDTTRILTAYAAAFMEQQTGPWFLWIHFMDPHTAYDPPDAYRTQSGPWRVFCNADPYWGDRELDEHGLVQVEPEFRPYVVSLYEGEIRYIDDAVGLVLERLDATGTRPNTLIGFTSDHGEELWEHGQYGHGHALYDELLHVPLVLAGPQILPQRIEAPFSAVHVMPTLAELVGVPADSSWKGVSQAAALRAGQAPSDLPVFSQATHPSITEQPWQAVRQGDWKFIRGMQTGTSFLFNMADDPGEQRNLVQVEAQKAQELGMALDAWQESFPHTFSRQSVDTSSTPEQQDLLNRLQDLGYL